MSIRFYCPLRFSVFCVFFFWLINLITEGYSHESCLSHPNCSEISGFHVSKDEIRVSNLTREIFVPGDEFFFCFEEGEYSFTSYLSFATDVFTLPLVQVYLVIWLVFVVKMFFSSSYIILSLYQPDLGGCRTQLSRKPRERMASWFLH